MKLALLLLLLLLLGASIAHADAPKPLDPATRARASSHVKQADEFLKTKQWDKAIAEYQVALELTGEPVLIFDIALANDKAGRPEAALAGFQRYVAAQPSGPIADEAREDIARLTPIVERITADRNRAEAERARVADEQRLADEKRVADERARVARAERTQRADALDGKARTLRWVALGAGVVGLGITAVGAKYGFDARAAARAISDHDGPWTDALLAREADGRSAQTKMIVATSVGGAVLVGAGILYLVAQRSHGRAEELRIAIGTDGITVAGAF